MVACFYEWVSPADLVVTAWRHRATGALVRNIYGVKEHEQLGVAPGFTSRQEIHGTSLQLRRVLQVISLTTHALKLILIYKIVDVDTIKNRRNKSWNPRGKTSKTCPYQCSVLDSLYNRISICWAKAHSRTRILRPKIPAPFAVYTENRQPLPQRYPQRIDTPQRDSRTPTCFCRWRQNVTKVSLLFSVPIGGSTAAGSRIRNEWENVKMNVKSENAFCFVVRKMGDTTLSFFAVSLLLSVVSQNFLRNLLSRMRHIKQQTVPTHRW